MSTTCSRHARAGESAFLGHMADQHDRHAPFLGFVDESLRTATHLTDAARQRAERRIGNGLDRVDHDQFGSDAVDRVEDVHQVGLGMQPEVVAGCPETFGASLHLLGTLLGGDVQRGPAPHGEQLQQQRALADARFAAEERDRSGDEAATEDPVEFGDGGGDRMSVFGSDVADSSGTGTARRSNRYVGDVDLDVFGQRVPIAAAGTPAGPLRMGGTALAAHVDDSRSAHGRHHDAGLSQGYVLHQGPDPCRTGISRRR